MTVRIDDLDASAAVELTDDALDTVIGGRDGMLGPSMIVCAATNGQSDNCRDWQG
ncbi:hypothetical protein [Rhizohabitans arisaemae]|uniref:hypothetical protein n=1 Tax=Rhizohabitans arisaemae TaxID=2720610 RepID=UPI0024B272D8|nr:hypothetical protein [Rhizohabitans arisaemae]